MYSLFGRGTVSVKKAGLVLGVALLAVALVAIVAACDKDGDSNGAGTATIVGVWADSETGDTFEFTADGRFVSDETANLNMTYMIQGNEITFTSDFGSGTTVEFSLDGDTLQIEDYETGEFKSATRVE